MFTLILSDIERFWYTRYVIVEELVGFCATVHTCSCNQTEFDGRIQEWKNKGLKVSGLVCDLKVRAEREKLMETVSLIFDGKLNILVSFCNIPFRDSNFNLNL